MISRVFAYVGIAITFNVLIHGSGMTGSRKPTRNPAILKEAVVYTDFSSIHEDREFQSGLSAEFWAWSEAFPRRLDRAMAMGVAE